MTRDRIHQIIFEADTLKGKVFDIALLIAILLSVLVVMLESVESIQQEYGSLLISLEWIFTILFTIEYFLRIYSINKSVLSMLTCLIQYPLDTDYKEIWKKYRTLWGERIHQGSHFTS